MASMTLEDALTQTRAAGRVVSVAAAEAMLEHRYGNGRFKVLVVEGTARHPETWSVWLRGEGSTFEKAIQDVGRQAAGPRRLRMRTIVAAVAAAFSVPVDRVRHVSRKREFVRARHAAMYLGRRLTDLSLKEVGEAVGRRDHTTVLYGVEMFETALALDASLREHVEAIVGDIWRRHFAEEGKA